MDSPHVLGAALFRTLACSGWPWPAPRVVQPPRGVPSPPATPHSSPKCRLPWDVLVPGSSPGLPAPALREVLEGTAPPEQYPAKCIQPGPERLLWLVDEAAGAELQGR